MNMDPLQEQLRIAKSKNSNQITKHKLSNVKQRDETSYARDDTVLCANGITQKQYNKFVTPQPIKINRINNLSMENINIFGIKTLSAIRENIDAVYGMKQRCGTSFENMITEQLGFSIRCPMNWIYGYDFETYSRNYKTGMTDCIININSIPKAHMFGVSKYIHVKLYMFNGLCEEIEITYEPTKRFEMGNIVSIHPFIQGYIN